MLTGENFEDSKNETNSQIDIKIQITEALFQNQIIFEYKSKRKILGLPLFHILFTKHKYYKSEKGIIAVGNIEIGLISVEIFSLGLFRLGFYA